MKKGESTLINYAQFEKYLLATLGKMEPIEREVFIDLWTNRYKVVGEHTEKADKEVLLLMKKILKKKLLQLPIPRKVTSKLFKAETFKEFSMIEMNWESDERLSGRISNVYQEFGAPAEVALSDLARTLNEIPGHIN